MTEIDNTIQALQEVLLDRAANPRPDSYTSRLMADRDEMVKKVGEEAVEVILAAVAQRKERLVEESADLIYHLLVVLVANDIAWEDVLAELERRRR